MTTIALIRHRLRKLPHWVSLETSAILFVLLAAVAAALMAFRAPAQDSAAVTVDVPSAKAAALVAATSASAEEFRAVGDKAKLINCLLYTSPSPRDS